MVALKRKSGLFRDQNLELMDAYLTNGGRSIPKTLAAHEPDWTVMAKPGDPDHAYAMDLVARIKANPDTSTYLCTEELHKWYAIDKQQAIQMELAQEPSAQVYKRALARQDWCAKAVREKLSPLLALAETATWT